MEAPNLYQTSEAAAQRVTTEAMNDYFDIVPQDRAPETALAPGNLASLVMWPVLALVGLVAAWWFWGRH